MVRVTVVATGLGVQLLPRGRSQRSMRNGLRARFFAIGIRLTSRAERQCAWSGAARCRTATTPP